MTAVFAIGFAVAVTYAINTWKIRLVAKGKALPAATMEATQGFLYLYVLVEILRSADTALGIGAYVVGTFVGTIGAMFVARRSKGPLVPHHHDCCPPPGTPGTFTPVGRQPGAPNYQASDTGQTPATPLRPEND